MTRFRIVLSALLLVVLAACGSGDGVLSSLPDGVRFERGDGSSASLVLVSSNHLHRTVHGRVYQVWIAEVENHGPTAACDVLADVELQDGGGRLLASAAGAAEAAPYRRGGLATSTPCIPSGGRGVVHDAKELPPVDLAAVRRVVYTLRGFDVGDGVPHPLAPAVVDDRVVDRRVAGRLVGRAGRLARVGVTVFPRGEDGLLVDRLTDFGFEVLAPGDGFAFSTSACDGVAFHDYELFVDFRTAAAGAPEAR